MHVFPSDAVLIVGADGNLFTPGGGPVLFTDGVIGAPGRSDQHAGLEAWTNYTGFNDHQLRFGAGFKYVELTAKESKNFGTGVLDGTQRIVGGDLTDVTGASFIYMPDSSRKLYYSYIQDQWSFDKHWDLTAGVRYDYYSDFGDTVNPRLALVWETRCDLTTKLLYGRAFRAPSFQELYVQNNPNTLGNPDLDPETVDTVELAFDYQPLVNLQAIFNVFAYQWKEKIGRIPHTDDAGNPTQIFANADEQEGYGFEIEVDWEITDAFRLYSNFAWRQAEDKETKESAPDAPGMQFYLNPHWAFLPDWSVDAQLHWVYDRKRSESDPRDEIDDYTLVNLTLRRKNIAKYWDFALAVRNVFDEDVREPTAAGLPDDLPMEGRSIYAEVRFHYK